MKEGITVALAVLCAVVAPGAAFAAAAAPGAPPQHQAGTAPPVLAARFDLASRDPACGISARSAWHLVRADTRVETFTRGAPSFEIWERDGVGQVTLKRVFDADRRIIEYSNSALRTAEQLRPWAAIASVIDPQLLRTMQRAGTRATQFGPAQAYRHTTPDGTLEIWWLPAQQLPARLLRSHARSRIELRLRAVHPRPPSHWNAPAARDDYLTLDAIDFGDMHYDPFVRKVEWIDAQARPFGSARQRH